MAPYKNYSTLGRLFVLWWQVAVTPAHIGLIEQKYIYKCIEYVQYECQFPFSWETHTFARIQFY